MRGLAIGLWILAAVLTGLWVLFYVWVQGMACAFVTSGNCRMRMPWDMSSEDFRYLVLIPGAMVAGVVVGAWLVGRNQVAAGVAAALAGLAVGLSSVLLIL